MKRAGFALLLTTIIACTPAFARDSVVLYGIVDTGVEFITNVAPTGESLKRMPVIGGGDRPSRWGLKGAEDLGGGLKAIFTLESGFSLSNGMSQQAKRLFGRQAYVGLSGSWGQLTFGRQYSMQTWGMLGANIIGPAGIGSVGSLDSGVLVDRFDNAIAYKGAFSGVTIGASYSFGRNASPAGNCAGQEKGDSLACRALSAMLKYDAGSWGVAATYEELRGGPGASPAIVILGTPGVAFTKSADTDRRYQLNAHFAIGSVRFGVGWIHRVLHGDTGPVKTDMEYLGASVPYGAWRLDVQISHISNGDYDADGTLGVVRANYNFSKQTAMYGLVGYMMNKGEGATYSVSAGTVVPAAPLPGTNQTGLEIGIRHIF